MNIFGSTTPDMILASVRRGVQISGAPIWPLFVFVGVPIAFVIGTMLVDFIQKSVADRSFRVGGFYVRDVPYAGYNRWRSEKWNMEHTA